MITATTISAIGAIAHAALTRTHGAARVLARLTSSTYLTADDTLVWLGPDRATLHPRAILAGAAAGEAAAAAGEGDALHFAIEGLVPWRPEPLALDRAGVATISRAWGVLVSELDALGTPEGFGALLTGAPLAFPLEGARRGAEDLARACAHDDAAAATTAALELLGVGGGLTPSGDDFVGAALFARRLLADAGAADVAGWQRAVTTVLAAAPARTHPLSAALLGDLADGQAHASLHDLMHGLARDAPAVARDAARRLVRLGHSSGWDMLAGLAAGLAISRFPPRQSAVQ
jgi:hypothetical protein